MLSLAINATKVSFHIQINYKCKLMIGWLCPNHLIRTKDLDYGTIKEILGQKSIDKNPTEKVKEVKVLTLVAWDSADKCCAFIITATRPPLNNKASAFTKDLCSIAEEFTMKNKFITFTNFVVGGVFLEYVDTARNLSIHKGKQIT